MGSFDQTDLSSLLRVVQGDKNTSYSSKAVSLVSLPPGALLTKITTATPASHRAYTSVQVSADADIELNSDLVYCNHSCNPSVVFDMAKFEVRVVDDRPLKAGDDLTFFYPSSEWRMQQPFGCGCGAGEKCLGTVKGAEFLGEDVLRKYWLNPHIEELLSKRNGDLN